jgi:sortase A
MTKSRKRPKSRLRRWIERSLLVAGVIGVGVWGWSTASHAIFQDWESWVFEGESRGQPATIAGYFAEKRETIEGKLRSWVGIPATPAPPISSPSVSPSLMRPPVIEKDGLVGRLAIPRLHLMAMVREGADEPTLRLAVGHIPGTALPGQFGNVGVAGHRDTLFRALRRIEKDDLILFETLSGNYAYQVEATDIVSPNDVSVLKVGDYSELTLVTCYPFYYIGPSPDRFIVKARQVATNQMEQQPNPQEMARQGNEPTDARQRNEPSEPPLRDLVSEPDPLTRLSTPTPHRPNENSARRQMFEVRTNHSRQLSAGVSLGVTATDVFHHRVNGWMWVMPDRRTIWLHNHSAKEPVIFYGRLDGKERELVITAITKISVKGYLLLPEQPTN